MSANFSAADELPTAGELLRPEDLGVATAPLPLEAGRAVRQSRSAFEVETQAKKALAAALAVAAAEVTSLAEVDASAEFRSGNVAAMKKRREVRGRVEDSAARVASCQAALELATDARAAAESDLRATHRHEKELGRWADWDRLRAGVLQAWSLDALNPERARLIAVAERELKASSIALDFEFDRESLKEIWRDAAARGADPGHTGESIIVFQKLVEEIVNPQIFITRPAPLDALTSNDVSEAQ